MEQKNNGNIIKLEKGKVFKNYKELCTFMDWSVKGGNGKIADLKKLDTICKWHKEGNKYIVDEVFTKAKKKTDNRGKSMNSRGNNKNQYINNIELNMLMLLAKDNNEYGELIGSKNVLLEKFGLINKNYVFCKRRQNKLSNYLDIDLNVIADFYKSVDTMVVNSFESALNNLNKRKLVIWSNTIMLCKNITVSDKYDIDKEFSKTTVINEYGEKEEIWTVEEKVDKVFSESTKTERQIILKAEKQVLKDMGYDHIQQVFKTNRVEKYYSKVYDIIRKEIKDFRYYYKAYKITYNLDDVIEELHKCGYDDVEDEHTYIQIELTNIGVKEKSFKNAKSRHNNAKRTPTPQTEYRCQLSFLDNFSTVINNVIDKDKKSIVADVRKTTMQNKKDTENTSEMPF